MPLLEKNFGGKNKSGYPHYAKKFSRPTDLNSGRSLKLDRETDRKLAFIGVYIYIKGDVCLSAYLSA